MKLPEKHRNLLEICIKKSIFCEIGLKNENFSEIFLENQFFLPGSTTPRFQTRLTPLQVTANDQEMNYGLCKVNELSLKRAVYLVCMHNCFKLLRMHCITVNNNNNNNKKKKKIFKAP